MALLERNTDEDPATGMLSAVLRILTEVHRRFFEQKDAVAATGGFKAPDVRRHLAAVRREVLGSSDHQPPVRILFSRVIPLDCVDPSAHPMWKLAEELGASCSTGQGDTSPTWWPRM
jgi:RNA polymerase II C-terminal domain phosphatase-like 3/4